ncbi:hypothetical protein B0O80DRAFT_491837 [Mortierella sp. GBAus27b]|nr:hypothetical protein B0O80DRAFT_491837 [Mortierella sp. GBAus27b]
MKSFVAFATKTPERNLPPHTPSTSPLAPAHWMVSLAPHPTAVKLRQCHPKEVAFIVSCNPRFPFPPTKKSGRLIEDTLFGYLCTASSLVAELPPVCLPTSSFRYSALPVRPFLGGDMTCDQKNGVTLARPHRQEVDRVVPIAIKIANSYDTLTNACNDNPRFTWVSTKISAAVVTNPKRSFVLAMKM